MTKPPQTNTVKNLLTQSLIDKAEARVLLAHALKKSMTWLIAHDDEPLPENEVARYMAWVQQRSEGQPIAYILGYKEFMGHEFHVTAATLIPRPDTELLVETALHHIAHIKEPRVLDLGTGSGAIAISIALARPDAQVIASDISPSALNVARTNAQRLGADQVTFIESHWFDAIPPQAFDIIVSNPPYIEAQDQHLIQGDLRFEPQTALTDFKDGLSALAHIIHTAPGFLKPDSMLWVEHGWNQADHVRTFLQTRGYFQVRSLRDLANIERITGGYFST